MKALLGTPLQMERGGCCDALARAGGTGKTLDEGVEEVEEVHDRVRCRCGNCQRREEVAEVTSHKKA